MSGAWDGSLVLTCRGGPWNGQERVWRGRDLEVTGRFDGRYVASPTRRPGALVWSTDRRTWMAGATDGRPVGRG